MRKTPPPTGTPVCRTGVHRLHRHRCRSASWPVRSTGWGGRRSPSSTRALPRTIADKLHHGNTVVFATRMADHPASFPDVPWATAVSKDYADLGGQVTHDHDNEGGLTHFWEYGQQLDPFQDAEEIRDHLFCAIYGTFATAKRLNP